MEGGGRGRMREERLAIDRSEAEACRNRQIPGGSEAEASGGTWKCDRSFRAPLTFAQTYRPAGRRWGW